MKDFCNMKNVRITHSFNTHQSQPTTSFTYFNSFTGNWEYKLLTNYHCYFSLTSLTATCLLQVQTHQNKEKQQASWPILLLISLWLILLRFQSPIWAIPSAFPSLLVCSDLYRASFVVSFVNLTHLVSTIFYLSSVKRCRNDLLGSYFL